MKKIYFIIIILVAFLCKVHGQENLDHFSRLNAIKINPFTFGNAEFRLSYEHYFKDRKSSISIIPSVILKEANNESKEGWQVMGQYRFYLTHLRKDMGQTFWGLHNFGFYSGLYGLYLNYNEDYQRSYWDNMKEETITENHQKDINSTEGGALIGIQVDITRRIIFDFYVGGGIRYTNLEDTYDMTNEYDYYDYYDVFDPEYQGVKPRVGFNLGITF